MFGLFRKTGFEAEMAELDKKNKSAGAELLIAMNSFQLQRQAEVLLEMAEICGQKAHCCEKYGKFDEMQKWEDQKQKALELHG